MAFCVIYFAEMNCSRPLGLRMRFPAIARTNKICKKNMFQSNILLCRKLLIEGDLSGRRIEACNVLCFQQNPQVLSPRTCPCVNVIAEVSVRANNPWPDVGSITKHGQKIQHNQLTSLDQPGHLRTRTIRHRGTPDDPHANTTFRGPQHGVSDTVHGHNVHT